MATTTTRHRVLDLEASFRERDGAPDARRYVPVRRELGIGAFGVIAIRAGAGEKLVSDRTATQPGGDRHEELFVVLAGRAQFTVDGEDVDAPAGTAIFVRDVEATRAAVALEPETTLLVLGGRRGEAWRPTPGEAIAGFWPHYRDGDFEGALAVVQDALADYPGNALLHYNVACMSSLLGRPDDALQHLRVAIEAHPPYAESAREDEDFRPLRGDPRFGELVA